jgi:non-ribosomal peptide synthetase component F
MERLLLPTDRPRVGAEYYSAGRVELRLSAELTRRLAELSRQQELTLFTTLLTGYAVLLGRWSTQDEVVIGVEIENLRLPDVASLVRTSEGSASIGISLHGDPSVEQLLQQVAGRIAAAQGRQDLSLGKVDDAAGNSSRPRSFQVSMQSRAKSETAIEGQGATQSERKVSETLLANGQTKLELSLLLCEADDAEPRSVAPTAGFTPLGAHDGAGGKAGEHGARSTEPQLPPASLWWVGCSRAVKQESL